MQPGGNPQVAGLGPNPLAGHQQPGVPATGGSNKLFFLVVVLCCFSQMTWQKIVGTVVTLAGGMLFMIYHFQEKLVYLNNIFPQFKTPQQNPAGFRSPQEKGLNYEDVYINTPDGLRLHAWFIFAKENPQTAPTLVFFHANAGNMGLRLPNIEIMAQKWNANIFMLSYRGYGNSEGEPDERGLKIDAVSAMQHVLERTDIDKSKIFVFGRSLGGAVAIHAARKFDEHIAGVIVENTFTCISDMVGKVFPWLNWEPMKTIMLKMRWNSVEEVKSIESPMMLIGGKLDEVVPHEQHGRLVDAATKARFREVVIVEDGTHNDTWMKGGDEYWEAWNNFIKRALDPAAEAEAKAQAKASGK